MGNLIKLHNDWSNIPLKQETKKIYHYTSQRGVRWNINTPTYLGE